MSDLTVSQRIRALLRRSSLLRRLAVAVRHRELHPDDTFIASYPRSGNTWIRFVLADLASGAPADFESVDRLIPNVGHHRDAPALAGGNRLIKTHEAYREEYRRAVYIFRDVRDVLISWYRATRPDPDDTSDLDAFVRQFVTDRASPYGRWDKHVRSWRQAAAAGVPVLICRFEEFRTSPVDGMLEIASFVGVVTDRDRVQVALDRNSPEAMRELEKRNLEYLRASFGHRSQGVGSGAIGNWQELLTPEHERILEPLLRLNSELGYELSPGTTAAR